MSQRFARELHNDLPEVDAFIRLDQVSELGKIVEGILGKSEQSQIMFFRSRSAGRKWIRDVSLRST